MPVMFRRGLLAGLFLAAVAAVPAVAAPFALTSPDFDDNRLLAKKFAGAMQGNAACTGENLSPTLRWRNVPPGTKSLVLLVFDPEGRKGLGVSHLVAYNIPPTATGFAQGDLSQGKGFTGGKNSPGTQMWHGPCPPPGSGYHHYTFTLIATDLPPDALPAGLTREELLEKLEGHAISAAGLIGRFGQ